VKIGFIDFQGLVGRAENGFFVFRAFHKTAFHGLLGRALSRQSFWRTVEVYLIGRLRLQGCYADAVRCRTRCTRPIFVLVSLTDSYGVQVNLRVFQRTQRRSTKTFVAPPALAIHADLDAFFLSRPVKASLVNCEPW